MYFDKIPMECGLISLALCFLAGESLNNFHIDFKTLFNSHPLVLIPVSKVPHCGRPSYLVVYFYLCELCYLSEILQLIHEPSSIATTNIFFSGKQATE